MNSLLAATCILVSSTSVPARADEQLQKPVAVPFDLLATKHIVIKVKINGKGPYRVIFDTGAPVSLINTRTARASGLLSKDSSRQSLNLFGPAAQTNIKTLQIGDLKAEGVPVIVMDHPTVEVVSKILGPVEGIIGFPFFSRYTMTLDYQAKQMTFVPNSFEPADVLQTLMVALMARDKPESKVLSPAGLWGMVVERKPGDLEAGVVIKEVLADGAARQAGLKVGDRLLTIDDRWTDTIIDCYTAADQVQPGTSIEVRIKRGDKEMTVKVKPDNGL